MAAVKKFFARELILALFSHFQNDGATGECNTLVLLQIQLAILCFYS